MGMRGEPLRTVAGMRTWAGPLAVAAGYFGLALLAEATALETSGVIAFWPASGLLVGVLLLSETRRWPALLAAGAVGAAAFNLRDGDLATTGVLVAADVAVAL